MVGTQVKRNVGVHKLTGRRRLILLSVFILCVYRHITSVDSSQIFPKLQS